MMTAAMPEYPNVVSRSEVIKGIVGNDIALYVHTSAAASETPRPCLLHTHGGGMVVVGVEFRNGGGALANHPFPAGLNDCFSALQWTHENKTALGISHIVISGESGGGNLAIATTLKAKREGCVDLVGGVYAACPYISAAYAVARSVRGTQHGGDLSLPDVLPETYRETLRRFVASLNRFKPCLLIG